MILTSRVNRSRDLARTKRNDLHVTVEATAYSLLSGAELTSSEIRAKCLFAISSRRARRKSSQNPFPAKQVATSGRGSGEKIYIQPTDIPREAEKRSSLKTSETAQKESLVAVARRGEITSKSPENLSDHFLNSAFARLAYYFYGCWGRRRASNVPPEQGGGERGNAARSISNMLINDPFERRIGGVGVLRILLSVRAPSI